MEREKRRYKIGFCTLTLDEHQETIQSLKNWGENHPTIQLIIEIFELPLTKLRSNDRFPFLDSSFDLIIVAHYAEGRLLLTNNNGLYNSFLQVASRETKGNVLLVITRDDLDQPTHDMDPNILSELERCGQHLATTLSAQKRLLSSQGSLSRSQLEITELHLTRQTNPIHIDSSLPTSPHPTSSSSSFCPLL